MTWDDNFCWISCDVCNLYLSIPHALGLQAVSFFLNRSGQFSLILQEFIIMCLEYLLNHNFSMFDGDYYLQKCRASMGAKFSLSLANLYMGWWDRLHIFGTDSPRRKDTIFYSRYIDDLLFIYSEPHVDMEQWLDYMNDNVLNLRFTGKFNTKSIVSGCSVDWRNS